MKPTTQRDGDTLQNLIPLHVVTTSSRIIGFGYSAEEKTLAIQFKPGSKPGETTGPIYHYFDFPQEKYDAITGVAAKALEDPDSEPKASVGTYFYNSVNGQYAYQQIEPKEGPRKNADGSLLEQEERVES